MAGSNLIYLEEVLVKVGMHLTMVKRPLLMQQILEVGHSYVRFLEQSLQDLEHVCLTIDLVLIDQTSEAWAIIEAQWKDLRFLFLLIMSLKME